MAGFVVRREAGPHYHIVMGIGLVTEIVHSVKEFETPLGVAGNLFRSELPVAISVLLLVNQVGSLSHLGKRRHASGSLDSQQPS